MPSSRLKHWSLTIQAYEYNIRHKPGKRLANADALSRLPLSKHPQTIPVPGDINLVLQHLNTTPVTATEIKAWTDKDPVLSKVRKFVMTDGQLIKMTTRKPCILILTRRMNLAFRVDISFVGHVLLFHLRDVR